MELLSKRPPAGRINTKTRNHSDAPCNMLVPPLPQGNDILPKLVKFSPPQLFK